MGFFDKVKKALGSKKEYVESQNDVNEEVIDESTFTESIEKDNENFNDDEEIHLSDSEEIPANNQITDKSTPNDKIRNFEYLDDLIHSGVKEIVLDSDIALSVGEMSEYKEGIKLDVDDLVIDGNGHTIDAKRNARIFDCTGKDIIIRNIVLANGYVRNGKGGAIQNAGGLTMTDAELRKNTAETGKKPLDGTGGAIWNKGVFTIFDCTIKENISFRNGGAIYNNGGELIINGSIFNKNRARFSSSGAITNAGGKVNISDSIFNENTAKRDGGAISNYGTLIISDSTFNDNSAGENGGAIYNGSSSNATLRISKSTLNKNTSGKYGDAIYNNMGYIKVFNCKILNHNSQNNIIYNRDFLQFYNSSFKDNISKNIISNIGDESNLSIFHGGFIDNDVSECMVFNRGKFCIIEKSIFKNINPSKNIINQSDLNLINPKLNDEGKTILNEGVIHIKDGSPNILNSIYGDGKVKTGVMIPNEEKFDFGYLDKKIHESNTKEIILQEDIYLEEYEYDFYEGGVELDIDNLVIDGGGHTIDGADKSRIFLITGNNIILKNLIFKNGRSHKNYDNPKNNNGGAIKSNYNINLTIENCKFIKNISEKNGGAIINSGKLTITESALTGNNAKEGGAIHNEGNLTITKSTLTENTAKDFYGKGGAIYNEGNLTITGSTLNNNTANGDGGVIYSKLGSFNIVNSQFNNNQTGNSGTIYNDGGELSIYGSTFSENRTDRGGVANLGRLIINNSRFVKNISNLYGGAIVNAGEVIIIKTIFEENKSDEDGGAIWNCSESWKVFASENTAEYKNRVCIMESTFNKNIAQGENSNGGAISNCEAGCWISISKSTFTNNMAYYKGGAIYNNGGELTINNSRFDENIANENGMDIFNNGQIFSNENISKIIKIYNEIGKFYHLKSLKNNQKDFTYLNELINAETNEIKLENDIILNIENNEQKTFENGIEILRKGLVIDGNGHTIDAQGLARIFYCTGKNIVIKNITLKNGFAVDGGAIYNSWGELTITESTLTENTSECGGAICNNMAELTIVDTTLIGNTSQEDGGAICNNEGELAIAESTFKGNSADQGGAIHNRDGSSLTITESTLTENDATFHGGAIHNKGELTIIKSKLAENTARYTGGAINSDEGELTITKSTLKENTAQGEYGDGGAIYTNKGKLAITESAFNNNAAQRDGGAIHNNGELRVTESTLTENTAKRAGGAIHNEGELRVTESTLTKNIAKIASGAIHNNGELRVIESTLTENIAKSVGGAIYTSGLCIITGSALMNNEAERNGGGAIYKFSGELSIADSKISKNTAKRNGGAIANEKDELNIIRSILNNNLANGEFGGGAIISLGDVNIIESKFNGNAVKAGNGGAILLKDSKYESQNCTFRDNKPDDIYEEKD